MIRNFALALAAILPALAGAQNISLPTQGGLPPALAPAPDVVLSARIGAAEPVTFDDAVKRALAHNTSALIAAQEIVRTDGLLGQARAASLPLVVVGGSWVILDHDRILAGRLVQPGQSLQATATATMPLLAASRWYNWAHAAEGVDVARLSDADVQRTVAITAARAYLTVVAAHRAVDVSESAVKVGVAHEEYAIARRKGGVGNELDVKRAEQERWAAEVQLQAARALLARGREALGVICGGNGPLDSTGVPEVKFYPDLEQAEKGVAVRQDVKASAGKADLARATWQDSWSDWLPTVTGGFQGYVQTNAVDPTPPSGWVATFLLAFPVYEGGLRPGQAKERNALSVEADESLAGLIRQARSEVRLSFESMRYAYAGYDAARKGATSAAIALDLANQAWRAGATSNLEVIDAERRARDAATTAVIAEDAVRQANLDLLSAAGRFP
ncbi:MAG: TolC family protein [Deltaproteobacteria bacterium]